MQPEGSDLPQTIANTLGSLVVDILAQHVNHDKAGQTVRNEVQVSLVALGNYAAFKNREDLRTLFYELSDRTGGNART